MSVFDFKYLTGNRQSYSIKERTIREELKSKRCKVGFHVKSGASFVQIRIQMMVEFHSDKHLVSNKFS